MQSLVERNGWAWRKIRDRVMARDGRRCQLRLPVCTVDAQEVDHILPRAVGGTDDLENLRAVCRPCHISRGMGEEPVRPSRFSIHSRVVTRDYTRRPDGGA